MTNGWLARFYKISPLILQSPGVLQDEISDQVFEALAAGELHELDEALIESMPEGDPRADDPDTLMRAVALASLLKAMPDRDASRRMSAPGAITVLACQPEAMREDLVWVIRRLVPLDASHAVPDFVFAASNEAAREKAHRSLTDVVKLIGASPRAHVVMLAGDPGQDATAVALPEPVKVGPPDQEVIAAALSLTIAEGDGPIPELPTDPQLRAIGYHGLRIAMRRGDRSGIAAELRRMAGRLPGARSGVTLNDLAGYGRAETVARRLVADLGAWARGEVGWRDMPRAVLLHGEPGTGKTFLASAIAGSAGVPLITGSLAKWQAAGNLGDLLRSMRDSFAEAREAAPSVLFIDEIDSAGDRNGKDRHAENYRRQVVNALLELTDGALRMEGVALVAACNDPSALDAALVRPGRFDTIVEVGRPGLAATERILRHHARGDIDPADLSALARKAVGRTAAELDGAVREARSVARQRGEAFLPDHLSEALGFGREDAELLRRVAVHEAGHAIAAVRLGVGRVGSIVASPDFGHVRLLDARPLTSAEDVANKIAMLLAGRAAEELILGSPSTGAGGGPQSDLARASELALRLELSWGLTDQGILYHADPERALEVATPTVRARANVRLREAMARVSDLLKGERETLAALADLLVQVRILEPDERGDEEWFFPRHDHKFPEQEREG